MRDDLKTLKAEYSETIYKHYFPVWTGNGKNISCFSHEDKNPSLSVFLKAGEFRHHCHACGISGDVLDLIGSIENIPDAGHRIGRFKEIAGITEGKKKIIKTYNYTDAEGRLLFQVVRYEPKGFAQRRPDPNDPSKFIYNLQGVSLVPFNLPAILKSQYSFLVEGEGDCETLKGLGFTASCNPMGAGKWRPEYNEHFRGKRIYIIPDNDKPGRGHALQVARGLHGIATSIRVIELPGLKEKQDTSDWIAARQGKDSEEIKAELRQLVKACPEWTEPKTPAETPEGKGLLSSLIKWNDIEGLNTSTEYLLERLIPEGAITLLFGRGGIGKTSLTLQMIHAIAEGKDFAGLHTKRTPASYIDLENPLSVLKDRIKHIGQSDNILIWHGSCEPSPARLDRADYLRYFELPKGLIVFDTLRASFLGDENNSKDIAIIVDRLKQFRDKGYTILLLHHSKKSNDSIYKGSTAILDLIDHALCLEPIKDDDEIIDFDPNRIYKFGVKIKTRFEPFSLHLQFDPEIKGFNISKDPDTERIEAIYEILKESPGGLKQKELKERVRAELGLSEFQARRLLKRGENMSAWYVQGAGSGRENRALIYKPNFDWLIGQPIYSRPINLTQQETDKTLSKHETSNSQQTLDNACLVDRTEGVYPINITNHFDRTGKMQKDDAVILTQQCQICMLTPGQRTLCEVKKPCPKGGA